ncbi:hypothetical protein M407DRAFT_86385 [Tulasnella calospora MUT 4182]|uniref:Uncharacterized protein n=1 Tax=Tulasnella calospora MUT 4182 TaxID=1051891 RepID=A0A0C3L2Y6_9AGAM|nr:hypothetical protein M407DRAFT_86385 [Tulasnella calospora MUT 4182]
MHELCGLEPELYDCCKNSCMCFVGPYADLTSCRYCQHERFKPDGQPFNRFHYVPLIPQIKALYAGSVSATAMRYRSIHELDNFLDPSHRITDIYDSSLYRDLRISQITVNGHTLPNMYFEDPRDPKDHDSFTYIVVQELVKAAVGVDAYDAVGDEMFKLRIFCPWKCGDMPAAASAYTGGKHHGARHPCRICPIEGIRINNSSNLNHYIPITCPPDYPASRFDLRNLPLRTHSQWMQQAREVDQAPTQTEQRHLSQSYGINRIAITSKIPGFTFPWSVPYDFMHLLENTIKNYINLISGEFKELGPGVESYVIPSAIWKEIGSATAISNDTIPSAFGRRIPNVTRPEDRTYMTAEAYLVWATMYSRILLRGRFSQNRYYTHWCRFISIIERCLDFESTSESRAELRNDIHIWYSEYEKYRLPTCLLTIHAWIHIPDMIERCGPLWAYWCWVMERFCGQLSRAVSSRKWPYSSLNRRILEIGTLHTIRHMYSLEDRLPVYTSMYNKKTLPSYHDETEFPEITLLHPRTVLNLKSSDFASLRRRISKYLATQYTLTTTVADSCIPDLAEQWGRVQIVDADVVNSLHGYSLKEENHRDATFIQYELVVDLQAHRQRAAPVFQPNTFFGQLERVFVIRLEPSEALNTTSVTSLVLMDVNMCDTSQDRHGFWEYEKFRYREVIGGTSIRALVGRIRDRGKWVFVQRLGAIEHASFVS